MLNLTEKMPFSTFHKTNVTSKKTMYKEKLREGRFLLSYFYEGRLGVHTGGRDAPFKSYHTQTNHKGNETLPHKTQLNSQGRYHWLS